MIMSYSNTVSTLLQVFSSFITCDWYTCLLLLLLVQVFSISMQIFSTWYSTSKNSKSTKYLN